MVGGRCVPFALIALLAAACSVESGSQVDAGGDPGEDGGSSGPDAPPGAAGLVLEFRGVPALTASFAEDFPGELREVRLDLEDVRTVGDAAPGDERTSRDELRLEWWGMGDDDEGEDAPNNQPVVVTFSEAPPGLYSNVFAELKDYRLSGQVEVAPDDDHDFEIEDSPSLAISIPLGGVTLEAGETRRVSIDVSCLAAVTEIRWDEVTPDGEGDLHVTSSSSQIGSIRESMQDAFTYQADDEVSSGSL